MHEDGLDSAANGSDLHRARIDAGFGPGAGADDEAEDNIAMHDAPVKRSRFVDDEAGEDSSESL